MNPSDFSRRILLSVTGLSPQVVTETLYALTQRSRPPFIPTEVHLITTGEGAERARLALLSEDPGWFHRLRKEYALPDIAFDDSHVHPLSGPDDLPLQDIRSEEDNLAAADAITERVRSLTADPNSALHVSIAGGRKTMGFYLGYALSLFGRPQDRLSHILVSEPFESAWNFFYPTPSSRVVEVNGRLADCALARVTLADIPFVSLRSELPHALLAGRATFAATVAAARAGVAPPELVLDPATREIAAGGRLLRLPPAEFALLAVLAHRARKGSPPMRAPLKDVHDEEWAVRYLDDLSSACGSWHIPDSVERLRKDGANNDYLSQRLSRLHRMLRESLDVAARGYRIAGGRGRGYWLDLRPEAIRFGPIESRAGRRTVGESASASIREGA
jgi:CRISPR-associated protein (TIGR02584 family)